MKPKVNGSLFFAALISVYIALFLSFTTPVQANEEGTVDELFELFITEWIKPIANVDSVQIEVIRDFTEILKNSRQRFGHLPEFWELMAQVYLRRVDIKRHVHGAEWRRFNTQSDFYLLLNPKMLEKALEIDPDRPAALWNLGRIQGLDSWRDWHEMTIRERYDAPPEEYTEFYANGLASAGKVDPDNGYYPFFEGVKRARLGNFESALELFKRSSVCLHFSQPVMFPQTYAIDAIDDFKEGTGVFKGFTQSERRSFSVNFYFSGVAENIPEIRLVYRGIIENYGGEWRDTFNVLNAAACRLGKDNWGDTIYQLTAVTLIKICQGEALATAKETGDKDLEIALLALWHEAENIRLRYKTESSVQDRTYMLMRPVLEELFEFEVDPSNEGEFADFTRYLQQGPFSVEDLDQFDMWLTDMMTGVLYIVRDAEFSSKFIWHIFERIEIFDYEDPLWWYVWWEMEGRYSPAKDEESYREHCWT